MNRIKALKIINILLMITFLAQALSGIGHDVIGYGLFNKIHPAGGLLLIILVIIHLLLNWGWIKTSYLKKSHVNQ